MDLNLVIRRFGATDFEGRVLSIPRKRVASPLYRESEAIYF